MAALSARSIFSFTQPQIAAQNARFSTIISHIESEEKERRPATAVHRHGYQSHMQVPRVLSHSGSG